MGGFVGMRLAVRRPELLRSLILLETSAETEPGQNRSRYRVMAFVARWLGLRLVAGRVMPILFGRKALTDPARREQVAGWRRMLLSNSRVGTHRATLGVIGRAPVPDGIDGIGVPTLVVVGDQDVATPPDKARRIHERIPGSRLSIIPGAGHSCTVEEPAAVNAALDEFLTSLR
jgi:pimeloyl-ACP methyl ester carboxylesterase